MPSGAELVGSILGLATLGVAYPILDLLGSNANFFVARNSPLWEPLGLAILLAGVLPSVTVAAVVLARRVRPSLGQALHLVVLVGLVSLVAIQFLNQLPVELATVVSVVVAVALGVGSAFGYRRSQVARSVMAYGWALPPLVAVMFLFVSPVSRIVLPAGTSALASDAPQRTPPVVMIILDELPTVSLMEGDGSVDEELFPTFARLAEDGTWYRNTSTVAAFTMEAVPAILTGEHPEAVGAALASLHPNSLFNVLSSSYDVRALETVTRLCPAEVCGEDQAPDLPVLSRIRTLASDVAVVASHALAPDSLRDRLIPMDNAWGGFAQAAEKGATDDDIGVGRDEFNERAREIFDSNRRDDFLRLEEIIRSQPHQDDPSFFFLHTLLPHGPWEYLPSGKRYGALRLDGFDDVWGSDPWLLAKGRQRHMLQASMVDRAIGGVLQALEDTGRYDDAMIVVTADHGVTFEPGNDRRTLEDGTVGDIAMVPLFIKYPGSTHTGISDVPVENVDIVPTVLDVLGLDHDHLEGRSLLDQQVEPRTTRQIWQRGELLPLPADDEPLDEALARKVAAMGSEGGLASLFRFAQHGDLVGSAWSDLADGPASTVRVELGQTETLADTDLGAPRLPVHITGVLLGTDASAERHLAISINGTIHAIAKSYLDRNGEIHFRALVPEDALVAGHNVVQVAEVVAAGDEVSLRAMQISPMPDG